MKVLVTGGKGFIGSRLAEKLEESGYDVVLLDKKNGHGSDVRIYENVMRVINGCNIIFHLAAVSNIEHAQAFPIYSSDVNVGGTLNVIEAAKKNRAKIVFVSSAAVYGEQEKMPLKETFRPNPTNLYGLQKYFGELYCDMAHKIYGVESVCLRYFNVYGPGQTNNSVVFNFLKNKHSGHPLIVQGTGKQTRSFIYIDDVIDVTIKAAESVLKKADIINIGTEKQNTILDVARLIGGEIRFVGKREGDITHSLPDISKAKTLLGWEPKTSLETGLRKTEEWFSRWIKTTD